MVFMSSLNTIKYIISGVVYYPVLFLIIPLNRTQRHLPVRAAGINLTPIARSPPPEAILMVFLGPKSAELVVFFGSQKSRVEP